MAGMKYDGVIEAARYAPDGRILMVRAYERRGATFSDRVLLDRNTLVEQLKKDKHSDLQSFSGVVARVLKAYIQDGTTVTVEKACPQCASTNLVYQQGCASCTACGWSKC